MGVFTKITTEDLAELAKEYDLGKFIKFDEISHGTQNSNFILYTENDKYILTIFEYMTNAEHLPFFMNLKSHLSERGINCPHPIKNRNVEFISEIASKKAAIVSFEQGKSITYDEITADHTMQVGQCLAKMHLAVGDFDKYRKSDIDIGEFAKKIYDVKDFAIKKYGSEFSKILEALEYIKSSFPTDLPSGVIHADLFCDNVFFKNGKLSGVIDFYYACNDFFVYDFAIAANDWCWDGRKKSLNHEKFFAMLNGYSQIREFSEIELDSMQVMLLKASLRFLATRLYDYFMVEDGLNVVKKDPTVYFDRVKFYSSNESIF